MSMDTETGDGLAVEKTATAAEAQGALLRQERERRGLSLAQTARRATLSAEQIAQIEDGGTDAFYSPAHKRLALRKYATTFGMTLAGLPEGDIEPDAQPSGQLDGFCSTDRTIARRPRPRIGKPAIALLLGALVFWVAYMMLQQLAAALPWPAPVQAPVPATLSDPVAGSASAVAAVAPAVAAPSADEPAAADCKALADGEPVQRWEPGQAKRRDTRLFLGSTAETEVCIVDADNTSTRLKLTPGVTAIVAGQPPYLLRSAQLPQLRIFFQGLKVKVPAPAQALQLFRAGVVRDAPPQAAPEDAAAS